MIATARRRTRRRRAAAGGAALAAAALVGAVAVAARPAPDRSQHLDVADGPRPTATTAPPASSSTTTLEAGPTAAPSVGPPEYASLQWFPLVDGVEVAWDVVGDRTHTWARSTRTPARSLGVEGTEPRAFAVPSRPGELVVVVFAGPGPDTPTAASVSVLDDQPDAATVGWADVHWDPVASVGWARVDWPGAGAEAQDLVVVIR